MNKFLKGITKFYTLLLILLILGCEELPTSVDKSDNIGAKMETLSNAETKYFTVTKDESNDKSFYFEINDSLNIENKNDLQFRWDFDGNDIWDTEWIVEKNVNFNYKDYDDYSPKLIVRNGNLISIEVVDQVAVMPWCFDVDGNKYNIVKIGNQWWMAENLKVKHFRNMDPIEEIIDKNQWCTLNTAAYCHCENNRNNEEEYGLLYNWIAVNEDRGIAPLGWHVPTDSEIQILINYLGGDLVAGGKMKEKGTAHWYRPNNASNSSGFTALPGGYRASNGDFHGFRGFGFLWSTTLSKNSGSWYVYMDHLYYEIVRSTCNKRWGFSVRCVKDNN